MNSDLSRQAGAHPFICSRLAEGRLGTPRCTRPSDPPRAAHSLGRGGEGAPSWAEVHSTKAGGGSQAPGTPQPLRVPGERGRAPGTLSPELRDQHTVVAAPKPLPLAVPHGSGSIMCH